MSNAHLYVRVSSKEQEKEGFSLDAQEKLGLDYAKRKGFEIVKVWKVSESAWREERGSFNQMVEYAKMHSEVRHIIFDVTDRMTRNDFDKLKIIDLIKVHGKMIHFSRSNKTIDKNSPNNTLKRPFFEVEFPISLYRVTKGAWKIGDPDPNRVTIWPLPKKGLCSV